MYQWDDKLIDALVEFLDNFDDSHYDTNFWHDLKHMEKYGFDITNISDKLHRILFSWDEGSPLFGQEGEFDNCKMKSLLLILRTRMREELGLPKISEKQKVKWDYVLEKFFIRDIQLIYLKKINFSLF